MRPSIGLLVALLVAACGGGTSSGDPSTAAVESDRSGGESDGAVAAREASSDPSSPTGDERPSPGRDVDWEDPEPPEAQAIAEQVVDAEWNQNKVVSIETKTSTLTMRISSFVDRTTGLSGFQTVLARKEISVEDRLDRLGAEVTETEVIIRLSGSVLFDFNSAAIRPDAARALTEVVEVVKAYGGRPVRVEGHTDSISSEEYNQKLSEERARSVAAWLTEHGVEASRLQSVGRGESDPVADNATAAGRQLNRRVEIVIEKGG